MKSHQEILLVHSVETLGTHEGPGIRLVIFLQGCHLRCLYCHNPDTWSLSGGKQMSISELLKLAEDEKSYIGKTGGVTVSGGEPLIQRKVLISYFKALKANGFHTALDTNGSILDDDAKELLKYTDLVLLDIKHMDSKKHISLTGLSNSLPLQFAAYLEAHQKPFWLRQVQVPGQTLDKKQHEALGNHFSSYKYLQRVELLPYHTLGVYKYKELGLQYPLATTKLPSQLELEEAKNLLSSYFHDVRFR